MTAQPYHLDVPALDTLKDIDPILTNEEKRRVEISMRLYALEQMLPYFVEAKRLAGVNLEKCQTEIKNLEIEKDLLTQGQIIFEDEF